MKNREFECLSGLLNFKGKIYSFFLKDNIIHLPLKSQNESLDNESELKPESYISNEIIILGKTNTDRPILFFIGHYFVSNNYIYIPIWNYIIWEHGDVDIELMQFNEIEFSGDIVNFLMYKYLLLKHKIHLYNHCKKMNFFEDDFARVVSMVNLYEINSNGKNEIEYKMNIFDNECKLVYRFQTDINYFDLFNPVLSPVEFQPTISFVFNKKIMTAKIFKYIDLFKQFVGFLVQNNKIDFDVTIYNNLGNKLKGDFHKYYKNTDFYYSPTKLVNVMNLYALNEKAATLIEKINKNEILVDHLPFWPKNYEFIDSKETNDLCRMVEYQYKRLKIKKQKPVNIKNLISDVNGLINNYFSEGKINDNEKQYLSGNLENWSLSLLDKFVVLFDTYNQKIPSIVKKFFMASYENIDDISEEEKYEKIHDAFKQFIAIRNQYAHYSKPKNPTTIQDVMTYNLLMSLILASDLSFLGVDDEYIDIYTDNFYGYVYDIKY